MNKSRINVKVDVLGTHNWPDAFNVVEFLKHEHHHQFNITVECDVEHNNREIEFILLRMDILDFVYYNYKTDRWIVKFGSMSCEMIANDIKEHMEFKYKRKFKVSVYEDNVQGGVIYD